MSDLFEYPENVSNETDDIDVLDFYSDSSNQN